MRSVREFGAPTCGSLLLLYILILAALASVLAADKDSSDEPWWRPTHTQRLCAQDVAADEWYKRVAQELGFGSVVQPPSHHTNMTLPEALKLLQLDASRVILDPLPYLDQMDKSGESLKFYGVEQKIKWPPVIHMTVKNKANWRWLGLLSISSWLIQNPTYKVLLYDDSDIESYVNTYFKTEMDLFSSIDTGIQRSDYFRYVVMCGHGGVYADVDTVCATPVDTWNAENGHDGEALIGIEEVWSGPRKNFNIQLVQWAFASRRKHELFCILPQLIRGRYMNTKMRNRMNWKLWIMFSTGPHVFTEAYRAYLMKYNRKGIWLEDLLEGPRVEGVRLMRQTGFGCNARFFHKDRPKGHLLYHAFRGSWKKGHAD